jgi:hypothetical protein
MTNIQVTVTDGLWTKIVQIEVSAQDYMTLKDYEMDDYDRVWDSLVTRLERMNFPTDDWWIDHIKF